MNSDIPFSQTSTLESAMTMSATIEAAGGLVERNENQCLLLAVIRRERYGTEWCLPKGKREPGESWQETALREVKEEIGLTPTIVGLAGATTYMAKGKPKLVLYWRMRVGSDTPDFVSNDETEELEWLTPSAAVTRLSHQEEVDLVKNIFPSAAAISQRRFDKPLFIWIVRIFRRHPWRRLSSAITAYEQELCGRAAVSQNLSSGLGVLQKALQKARLSLESGNIEQGWVCYLMAQRLELLYLNKAELNAAATAIRYEANKLNTWRRAAVTELLKFKDPESANSEYVFRAALLRDDHYHNEAYKDALRRSIALQLAIALVVSLTLLLSLSRFDLLQKIIINPESHSNTDLFANLLSVTTVGLLGSTVSAVTDIAKSEASARIPEMTATVRVTLMRLLIGPAAAILLYFVVNSSLYDAVFKFPSPSGYAILVVAFAAGFSERLVLRVVERLVGKVKEPRSGATDP